MKIKRISLITLVVLMTLFISGCDFLMYGSQNSLSSEGSLYYFFTRIEDIPDGWSCCEFQSYYYEVDTKIVYIGSNNLSQNNTILLELKSNEFESYIYDEESNKFIGVRRGDSDE